MLIGNKYADNKIYRGIKHYDSLPLTSEDLHEYADTVFMKNAFFMNNILGSGTLNEPNCILSSRGITLESPSVVLINGDISLVQKSASAPIVSTSEISTSGFSNGILCIIGWYQAINSSSTIKEYGGVNNITLTNDLINANLNVQVSTRYQFRWDTVLIDYSTYNSGESFQITIPNRNAAGDLTPNDSTITIPASTDSVKIAPKPNSMNSYSVSDLYIVPILKYQYSDNTISDAIAYRAVRPSGTSEFINSTTEPVGADYPEGTIWYHPTTYKFKFYVQGVGFVPTASDIALMQYNNTINILATTNTPSNILLNIGIDTYTSSDILQVIYNGVVLTVDTNYSINATTRQITLLDFVTKAGDTVTFIVTKLIDTTTATTISSEFFSHINSYGDADTKGHVSLSDIADSNISVSSNTAATPKAVYDATTIVDSVTNKKYRLSITNGVLGIVEIV